MLQVGVALIEKDNTSMTPVTLSLLVDEPQLHDVEFVSGEIFTQNLCIMPWQSADYQLKMTLFADNYMTITKNIHLLIEI